MPVHPTAMCLVSVEDVLTFNETPQDFYVLKFQDQKEVLISLQL